MKNLIKINKNHLPPNIVAIDPGKDGGITTSSYSISMPTKRIETKSARYVFDLDAKGKKQIIKSGPNKGQPKMKTKSPAKYEIELDLEEIMKHITGVNNQLTVVIETPGHTHGARSAATTHRNFGKLLACIELSGSKIFKVAPNKVL